MEVVFKSLSNFDASVICHFRLFFFFTFFFYFLFVSYLIKTGVTFYLLIFSSFLPPKLPLKQINAF